MKQIIALTAVCSVLLIGAGCSTAPVSPASPQVDSSAQQSGKSYTDSKTGIGFVIPTGWSVSEDESRNLLLTKGSPYSTVSFEVFTNKASWLDSDVAPQSGDVLVNTRNITIGTFPTTEKIFARMVNGQENFRYGKYFVDAGTKWFIVHTSDPSTDVTAILSSVKF